MKGKLIVILSLVLVLVFVVYLMIQHENEIRKHQIVKEYVQNNTGVIIDREKTEKLQKMAATADYYFKATGDYFQTLKLIKTHAERSWEIILLKGVNLGVAVPGKFPAEFSLSFDDYLEWLVMIGRMNSNIIRTYTILPPEFYDAFAQYNLLHQDDPLYLLQGVWATIPSNHDYTETTYTHQFQQEIANVINVLHGNVILTPQRGKASGVYVTDVSKYVAGIILGREWEPNAVFETNRRNTTNHYYGDFISMNDGSAMEAWLAEMMDFTVLYETQTYQMQHPISFVNWLPLDPMYHNTEIIENEKIREYDNDLESVHFCRFHHSELFIPGIFAAYHAYPYYPDFVYLKKQYAEAQNNLGQPDNYIGYLEDLKKNHPGMPLVIAEYGVPSSRGNSHITPLGFDQGGHVESEQAEISMTLTRDIFQTGCAGAIYFEWADEWFKHNWLVMDFEAPFDDRKLWHNMENPEQNFGILAMESRERTIDGALSDWPKENFRSINHTSVSFHADATYFYMAIRDSELNFTHKNLHIAIDTYDKNKGDKKLPFTENEFDRGFEFLAEFYNPDNAKILVDDTYSVYTDIYSDSIPVYASKPNNNGVFIDQIMLSNRGRQSLTDEITPRIALNRSALKHGVSSNSATSNADWYFNTDAGIMELRLPWHLLNVSDPAKNFVLDDKQGTPEIEYTKTEGFNIKLFYTDSLGRVLEELPKNSYLTYLWDTWETPKYTTRLKPLYDSLQYYFRLLSETTIELKPTKSAQQNFSITPFYQNYQGAVGVSFLGSAASQIELGIPILNKYKIKADFGIIPNIITNTAGLHAIDKGGRKKRFNTNDVSALKQAGHVLALQSTREQPVNEAIRKDFWQMNQAKPVIIIADEIGHEETPTIVPFVRNTISGIQHFNGFEYSNIDNSQVSQPYLDSILSNNQNRWLIFNYLHLAEENTPKVEMELHTTKSEIEKQLRLARNHNFWLTDNWSIYQYKMEHKNTALSIVSHNDLIFLKPEHNLNYKQFNHPLTIRFETNAPFIEVTSEEGIYTMTNRTGVVFFNAFPGDELTIKQIW